jgi:hypothetical protein
MKMATMPRRTNRKGNRIQPWIRINWHHISKLNQETRNTLGKEKSKLHQTNYPS